MSYSRIPGIVAGSGSTRRASPAASVSGVEEPGPVGMNDGGQCGQAPRMTGWPSSITWEQFEEKAERPEGETENAFIHAEADLGANVSVCREEGRLRLAAFVVNLRVVEENCWVVRGTKTDDLLSHEQGHFDLAGLNARELMGSPRCNPGGQCRGTSEAGHRGDRSVTGQFTVLVGRLRQGYQPRPKTRPAAALEGGHSGSDGFRVPVPMSRLNCLDTDRAAIRGWRGPIPRGASGSDARRLSVQKFDYNGMC